MPKEPGVQTPAPTYILVVPIQPIGSYFASVVFIFADESGNTGRAVFNDPPLYHLGAILSTFDAEEALRPVIEPLVQGSGVHRLHANEFTVDQNTATAEQILDRLDGDGNWAFSLTIIEKPYVATTKFVDTIFDSGENDGVPWLWYNHELFRHQLCVALDDILTDRNRRAFWDAFLSGDVSALQDSVRNAWTYIDRHVADRRVSRVIRDGFDFFLRHPERFSVGPRPGRRGYQGDTPNMIAFSCLLTSINAFAEQFNSPPVAFVHDRQDEFRTTMREWHEIFGPIAFDDNERGGWPQVRRVAHELPNLEIASSADSFALQAVDNLLWVSRRDSGGPNLETVKTRLSQSTTDYYISRGMSEMIVFARMQQAMREPIGDADLERAKRLMERMEGHRLARLQELQN